MDAARGLDGPAVSLCAGPGPGVRDPLHGEGGAAQVFVKRRANSIQPKPPIEKPDFIIGLIRDAIIKMINCSANHWNQDKQNGFLFLHSMFLHMNHVQLLLLKHYSQ